MYELVVHKDAEADLDALWESDGFAAADIEVLLEELRDDQVLLSALRIHQREEGRVHISRLLKFDIWGKALWRLKIWELADDNEVLTYRVIYAFQADVFFILGVMHRDQNYEQDKTFLERIKAACRTIGVPVPP